MSFFDQPIREFLVASLSSSPTPGGGSVSALVAALGSSMTAMATNVTCLKKRSEINQDLKLIANQLEQSVCRFEELLADDVNSFNAYMLALKMPQTNEFERAKRKSALEEALVATTEVPVTLAEICLDTLRTTCSLIDKVNKWVLSDLGIAVMLLETAGLSALLTARSNISSISDDESKSFFTNKCNQLDAELRLFRDDGIRRINGEMSP